MSFKLKIWPGNLADNDSTALELTFFHTPAIQATYKHKANNVTNQYHLTPIELSFCKQMYQPGEIHARIQITGVKNTQGDMPPELSLTNIKDNFKDKQVELTDGTKSIASNYYIYELTRDKRKEKVYNDKTKTYQDETHVYVDFKIYSLDKLLTLEKDNKTYVAKRLGTDILISKAGETNLPYTPAGSNSTTTPKFSDYTTDSNQTRTYNYLLISMQNKLKYGSSEFIQPYLVQYDESFYDMLIRTANRWGEFVYFEDGKLTLGWNIFKKSNDNTAFDVQTLSKYLSVSHIKSEAISISGTCAKAVVTDDYLEVIKQSHKPNFDNVRKYAKGGKPYDAEDGNEYIRQAGDMYALDDVYHHKVAQSFLNMRGNAIDWAVNMLCDDGWAASQNEYFLYKKELDYNKHFFNDPEEKVNNSDYTADGENPTNVKLRYGTASTTINKETQNVPAYWPYADTGTSADSDAGLNVKNYKAVLTKETNAGKDMLCVEMGDDADTNYQYLRLGDVLTYDGEYYIVTKVEGIVDDQLVADPEWLQNVEIKGKNENLVTGVSLKHKKSLRNRVYAIPKESVTTTTSNSNTKVTAAVVYPPMLPTGHIRFSGPQRGFIHDTLDPMMNGRYRVRMWWQTYDNKNKHWDGPPTPWLRVSREMTTNGSGGVWKLEKDTEVLLDFQDGNVELPYIVGTLQENTKRANARSTMFNNLDLTTPAGHAIRLSDGEGGGIANFFASFNPIWKLVQGYTPQKDDRAVLKDYGPFSKYFDGGMELTDKYGIYSIKASTDQRNISIKSPWGDVLLSAFTGITISAPNGDVKIQGKNVSIEARNNLSLTSGTNIANGLFGGNAYGSDKMANNYLDPAESVGSEVIKTVLGRGVNYLDIPVFRHFFELIIRPVCGAMNFKSYRSISLNAGFDATAPEKTESIFSSKQDFGKKANAWLKSNFTLYQAVSNVSYRFENEDWFGDGESNFGTIKANDTDIVNGNINSTRSELVAQNTESTPQQVLNVVPKEGALNISQNYEKPLKEGVETAQEVVQNNKFQIDTQSQLDQVGALQERRQFTIPKRPKFLILHWIFQTDEYKAWKSSEAHLNEELF